MNRLNANELAAAQAEAGRVAQALAERSMSLLDGARQLAALRHRLGLEISDEDFAVFVVIDSETDHIPNASARAQSSAEWLARCDQELNEAEAFYQKTVSEAVQRLIVRYAAKPHS